MARKTTSLPKRYLVHLAELYEKKYSIGGWLMSEKLDGFRLLWDGGASRGVPIREVPFANVLKEDRYVLDRYATGLWSRWGHPIFAPDSWLDKLPNYMLDGEIWLGRGLFNQTSSIVRRLPENRNDADWIDMKYMIYDAPSLTALTRIGEINEPHFIKIISETTGEFLLDRHKKLGLRVVSTRQFESQLLFLEKYLPQNDVVRLHEQKKLHFNELQALKEMRDKFDEVTSNQGEGLIVRAPHSNWEPVRSKLMLKVKKVQDDEAEVIGYTAAEYGETGAKIGLIGALYVRWKGITFKLSGLTDEERAFGNDESTRWAKLHYGEDAPDFVISKHFPRGSFVTFKYSELTPDGVPREARYFRKHHIK